MADRDPTIIGVCHPRDASWLNAGLNAQTREDWERVGELRAIARALENLAPVMVPELPTGTGTDAFAGVNREPKLSWADYQVSVPLLIPPLEIPDRRTSDSPAETLRQVLAEASGPESNPDPPHRARARSI